jgi:hypothetical protein
MTNSKSINPRSKTLMKNMTAKIGSLDIASKVFGRAKSVFSGWILF